MKISVVASGSKGNLTYIKTKDSNIIIDAGISKKRMLNFFTTNSITENIDAILITHEHADHIKSLKAIASYLNCPIYMTEGTKKGSIRFCSDLKDFPINTITNSSVFYVNNTKITAIPTFHDALDPCGYKIEDGDTDLVYITDTGFIPDMILPKIANASIYVMESNHDPEMLHCSGRPYETIMRILGDSGHLSNEDSLVNLGHIMGPKTRLVFYAHISEDCNLPEIIKELSKEIYNKLLVDTSNIEFVYTSQIPSKVYDI